MRDQVSARADEAIKRALLPTTALSPQSLPAKAGAKSIAIALTSSVLTSPNQSAKAASRSKVRMPSNDWVTGSTLPAQADAATDYEMLPGTSLSPQPFIDPAIPQTSTGAEQQDQSAAVQSLHSNHKHCDGGTLSMRDQSADAVHSKQVSQSPNDAIGPSNASATAATVSAPISTSPSALAPLTERDHVGFATLAKDAAFDPLTERGQSTDVTRPDSAAFDPATSERQRASATHTSAALAPKHLQTIDEIREQWRRRQSWHRAEKSLTLAAKAMCRRLVAKGDEGAELREADALYNAALGKGQHPYAEIAFGAIFPIIEARDGMEKHRKAVEKRLAKLAATLPIAPYIAELRGVGIGSLAAIVGEAGNLGDYANPAKLWKRMGLAVMPDGRQRKVAGAAAIEHGYSPQRRSVMWNIGDCIIKAGGPLRELYDARKLVEHAKAAAEGLIVAPAAKIPKKDADKYRSEGHIHNRAKRYVEKRVLLLLWRAWRASPNGE